MQQTEIQYRTDYFCRMKHPEDWGVDQDNAEFPVDGGTATFKLFDPGVDETVTVLVASGQPVVKVSNAGRFPIGSQFELEQDDGTFHNAIVNSVDAATGAITLAANTTDTAAIGKRVRRTFTTGPLSMTLYTIDGVTPAQGVKKWGYRGAMTDTGLHQILDQLVWSEMTLDGGAGKNIVVIECFKVVANCGI